MMSVISGASISSSKLPRAIFSFTLVIIANHNHLSDGPFPVAGADITGGGGGGDGGTPKQRALVIWFTASDFRTEEEAGGGPFSLETDPVYRRSSAQLSATRLCGKMPELADPRGVWRGHPPGGWGGMTPGWDCCLKPAAPMGLLPLPPVLSLNSLPPSVVVPIGLSPPSAPPPCAWPILTSLHPLPSPREVVPTQPLDRPCCTALCRGHTEEGTDLHHWPGASRHPAGGGLLLLTKFPF